MALPQRFLDDLIDRSDIVEVISKYVRLKRTGANYMGLCPFHQEKTPSFSVSADKQFFHCFGCGEGGNVLSFLMKIENLPFMDAVKQLAEQNGVKVPEDEGESLETRRRRERILALNKDAARYYHQNLMSPSDTDGLNYLKNRGLSKKTISAFGLGYAGREWDSLVRAMRANGYTDQELEAAWLARRNKSGGLYDIFRERVMFPIINVRGEVIAFGGRILSGDGHKYLNSSDTMVYQKSRNLFALNIAKNTHSEQFILAEGYMDVIALHQAGFDSSVASLGTALTADQARLMARYTKQVVICYDADEPGQKAAQRAIDILNRVSLSVRVLKVPGVKDPDEYIRKNGPEGFRLLLEQPDSDVKYRLNAIEQKYDMSADTGRVEYIREAVKYLASLPGETQQEIYSGRVAAAAGVSSQSVMTEVRRAVAIGKKRAMRELNKQASNPIAMHQPKERELRYQNPVSSVSEEKLIALVLLKPEYLPLAEKKVPPDAFSSDFLAKIYKKVIDRYNEGNEISAAACMAELTEVESKRLAAILTGMVTSSNPEKELNDYCDTILFEHEKQQTTAGDALLRMAIDRRRKG